MTPATLDAIKTTLTASEILDNHLQAFAEYDVERLVADYTADAVFFTPGGPLQGPDAIRPFFAALVSEFRKPGSKFTMHQRSAAGDCAYILWTAETAENRYEFATDTFVIRNGKIAVQSFAAVIKSKV